MDMNDIKANMLQFKGEIKEEYDQPTDNDLLNTDARTNILVDKLQEP